MSDRTRPLTVIQDPRSPACCAVYARFWTIRPRAVALGGTPNTKPALALAARTIREERMAS